MGRMTRWPGSSPPSRAEIERALASDGLTGYEWSNGPGDTYGVHSHQYNKVIYVVEGSITFTLPNTTEEVHLEPGDRLDLPAGVRHGANVGTKGVRCLEAHWT
jgi:quercetin dioxygenase-like cupin family protein